MEHVCQGNCDKGTNVSGSHEYPTLGEVEHYELSEETILGKLIHGRNYYCAYCATLYRRNGYQLKLVSHVEVKV